jgi:3-oxoadipate enol-lactonase
MPMPAIEFEGVSIHYELCGPPSAPTLVFSTSLGSDLHMWDKVVPFLEQDFRILRYDTRGHGSSSTPALPWSIEMLAADLIALLNAHSIERAHFCGLSLGGLVGLWLALHSPERINRLVLANTAARIGSREMWETRIATVKSQGMAALARATIDRWFTPRFILHHPDDVETIRSMIEQTSPEGYIGCCGVLRDTDLRPGLSRIQAPCLVIAGTHDPATPPADGRLLESGLRHARYLELAAAHLSAWEQPEKFAEAVRTFLFREEQANG